MTINKLFTDDVVLVLSLPKDQARILHRMVEVMVGGRSGFFGEMNEALGSFDDDVVLGAMLQHLERELRS